ncbi:MAG: Ldh family oxidoreductase [Candidatus Dormibacteraeota bacterium]|nr:Ldh family oxidoreductase [Candidatus Dormibacteraeota bacterium]
MREARLVDAEALRALTFDIVRAMGASAETAREVSNHLVMANLSGHDSHGVLRLAQYVAEQDRGQLVPAAEVELLRAGPVCALFDAHRGFGQRSTMAATEWVISRARELGVAAAAVRHSTHIGRLGEYAERLTGEGLIGLVTVGMAGPESGRVAPFGGTARFLGTNPWSIGVPAAGRPPMIFDAATSSVAEGKVRLAVARGVEVPLGTVLDPEGRPTRDPAQLYAGGTLSVLGGDLAGHKGFGLSLAAALVGGLAMIDDPDPTTAGTMQQQTGEWGDRLAGVFLVGIDPGAFGDPLDYQRRVAGVLDALNAAPPVPGVDRVQVAGDPERASRETRRREGIPIPPVIWEGLSAVAARFGVPLP